MTWFELSNIREVDSPALIIYIDRVRENINTLIASIDDVSRLRPHIKTHKSSEVSAMMLERGVRKFKCATIAEAEILGEVKAPDVLLAYQPVGPKVNRLLELVQRFPATTFSCLIDNIESASPISNAFQAAKKNINVFIDLNVGMNRTGIVAAEAENLVAQCSNLQAITVVGLHAYDGHLRDSDFDVRTKQCNDAFTPVINLQRSLESIYKKKFTIVAGGTPTYSIHCRRKEVECSPGTFIYWDKGYEQILQEQHYLHAALVITRVISKPSANTLCVDLGHKAIASENPLDKRVYFLNAPELIPTGHSEEHLILKGDTSPYQVGDVLYGVPYHVCPTIALHDKAVVAENGKAFTSWSTPARNRVITI